MGGLVRWGKKTKYTDLVKDIFEDTPSFKGKREHGLLGKAKSLLIDSISNNGDSGGL